jgi:hypothetical protein
MTAISEAKLTFKGKIETGVICQVGDVFQVRAGYDVREFNIALDGLGDAKNNIVRMQLTRDKINLLTKSHLGKKAEVWYFINGVVDKNDRIHNVINCVRLFILD